MRRTVFITMTKFSTEKAAAARAEGLDMTWSSGAAEGTFVLQAIGANVPPFQANEAPRECGSGGRKTVDVYRVVRGPRRWRGCRRSVLVIAAGGRERGSLPRAVAASR